MHVPPTHSALDEDADLVHRILHGSRAEQAEAFRSVIEKYQRQLYAMVGRIMLCHEDTDDVLQETFLRAYRSLGRYDSSQPLYPWLRRIALNVALSKRKTALRHAGVPLENVMELHSDTNAENPLQRLERDELSSRLRIALEALPADQRVVLQLRVYEQLSYQEIAESLGIRVGTVMSRLSRARDKLRRLLHDYVQAEVSS
jgi:RNA polymerase sigma-70 factor (ECF subfamily)